MMSNTTKKDMTTGLLLLACMAFSLVVANTSWGEAYRFLWHSQMLGHPLAHWINDGLMAVFFLLVGLELKRELLAGELRTFKRALLPAAAALGGMLVPAGLYLLANMNGGFPSGFGIPMSTDIAFVIGMMALLSRHIPKTLRVFMLALAVVDDLGAIIVIAFFYSSDLNLVCLLGVAAVTAFLLWCNRRCKVNNAWLYVLGGMLLWFLTMESGVHASIAGILLAIALPFRDGGSEAPARRWERRLHTPVYFAILPLFVLANTAVEFTPQAFQMLFSPHCLGIIAGLLIGKPLGICMATALVTRMGWASLPEGLTWRHVVGGGFLGGIGFTMSIFVTLLSFNDPLLTDSAKLAILFSSLLAAVVATFVLIRLKRGYEC